MEARASGLNAAALASRLRTRVAAPRQDARDGRRVRPSRLLARGFRRRQRRGLHRPGPQRARAHARRGSARVCERRAGVEFSRAALVASPARRALAGHRAPGRGAMRPLAKLAASRAMWRERHRMRRALWTSADLRAHVGRSATATAGRSSARSSRASPSCSGHGRRARWTKRQRRSTRCRPRVVVTYAEAGGWGRAIVLESRRRGIPSVGLQHGFIYRHWLNYLHEPDEMTPDPRARCGSGLPEPRP